MKHPPNNPFSLTNNKPTKNISVLSISKLQHLKNEVSEHLEQLHQGVNLNQNLIESTLCEVAENKFALAYLGLDEQKLKEIDILESKIRLQGWLEVLRNGTTLYREYLRCLYQEVERLKLTLAELETDKQELKRCEILGFKLSAEGWLKRIADGDYNSYFVLINFIREQVVVYELTLAEINTTEEKLEALMVFAAEKEALSWLKHLRENCSRNEYFTENLLRNVAIGGFSLKKIGTDEKELQKLLARPSESKPSKSYTISKNRDHRYKHFLENLFNRGLFFKVLIGVKRSFSWKESVWIKTFFSHLQGKINDWNLIRHQH